MKFRFLAVGAGVIVAGFHLRLLAVQFADGGLSDPDRMVRWFAAAWIAAMLVALARRGESLVGRKAIAAWALAAFLHGPVLAESPRRFGVVVLPEAAVSLLQIVIAGVAVGLTLLGAARDSQPPLAAGARVPCRLASHVVVARYVLASAARPPPACA